MSPELIGIAGGRGAIGEALVRHLWSQGLRNLRVGSRHPSADSADLESYYPLDIDDPQSLRSFCSGCRIVVNCSGPAKRIQDRVARSAFQAGADYVDPGGDEPLFRRLKHGTPAPHDSRAVLSAGFMPGLTGILPRWLAQQGFDDVHSLTAYTSIRDHFTRSAAIDYLDSLRNGYGAAQFIWRDGAARSAGFPPLREVHLPFFRRPVNAYPYLSFEAARLAHALKLTEARWYSVFDGVHVWQTLGSISGLATSDLEMTTRADQLIRAAEMDLFGFCPEQVLVFQLGGTACAQPKSSTLVMRASDTYALSAVVCAAGVFALLSGTISAGIHFGAEVLDPALTVSQVRASASVASFESSDSRPDGVVEEGTF